jgi:excisionase family DNA binding protein
MTLDLEAIVDSYRREYPPTLNTSQVAELLGSTPEVVRAKVAAGELPAYRWGKNFRYFRDEIIAWLHDQSVVSPTA